MATSIINNVKYPVRTIGHETNIIGYNSSSNVFVAPQDGYILVQIWGSNSSLSLWFNEFGLEIKLTDKRQSFIVFAVRGSIWHVTGSGDGRSAYFYPMT